MSSNDRNPAEWHRLINGALNDSLSAQETVELNMLLKSSAEARQLWYVYQDNECGLAELGRGTVVVKAEMPEEKVVSARVRRAAWSPLLAAAAGLCVGLFSATLVWGYVGTMGQRMVTLITEGFENKTAPAPGVTGFPVVPGVWSGDFTEVVDGSRGTAPAEGTRMLRFRRADYEGKPVRDGYVADVFRIVEVPAPGTDGEESTMEVEARFASMQQGELGPLLCGMTLYALDALPPEGMRDDAFLERARAGLTEAGEPEAEPRILASASRTEKVPADGRTWRTVRSALRLPAEARYCLLHLRAHLRGAHEPGVPKPVEFTGLYLDDVRVTLTQTPASTRP